MRQQPVETRKGQTIHTLMCISAQRDGHQQQRAARPSYPSERADLAFLALITSARSAPSTRSIALDFIRQRILFVFLSGQVGHRVRCEMASQTDGAAAPAAQAYPRVQGYRRPSSRSWALCSECRGRRTASRWCSRIRTDCASRWCFASAMSITTLSAGGPSDGGRGGALLVSLAHPILATLAV